MNVTIYHNPLCGTSRCTLALIRKKVIEPTIIEYRKVFRGPSVSVVARGKRSTSTNCVTWWTG